MRIATQQRGDVTVFVGKGKQRLPRVDDLRGLVRDAIDGGAKRLVINLEKVSTIDSGDVGELVAVHEMAKGRGVPLGLCCLGDKVLNIIQMTTLHRVFDISDHEDEAVAAT